MLKTSPVFVTIPCEDPHSVRAFYEEVLGLEPLWDSPETGEVAYRCGDGSGLMLYRTHAARGEHTLATFTVVDIDREMADLRAKGVVFEEYDIPGLRTERGVAVDDMGRSCWLKDPEGNIIALTEIKAELLRKVA